MQIRINSITSLGVEPATLGLVAQCLNHYATAFPEERIDVDSFCEELERVFDKFPKFHMNILLGDFNAKIGREDIFSSSTANAVNAFSCLLLLTTRKFLGGDSNSYNFQELHLVYGRFHRARKARCYSNGRVTLYT
jgi:hypothetical protein